VSDDWGGTLEDTRALATDAGGNLVRRSASVRVVDGPDAGAEVKLERESLVIGSGASADLVLNDPRVSRLHVELSLATSGIRVRDLDSRNGTFVGDARVGALVVPFGTRVRLGRTSLELASAEEPLALPLASRDRFGGLVGSSVAMRRLFAVLEQVAPTDAPVLLYGEAGSGKTAAALAIHDESGRAGEARFVDVSRAPSEADLARELAIPGTLVLEHVERASSEAAAAIVSALEARERTGGLARVLSTTREDPRVLAEAGAFARDLYFHLAAVRVRMPPLRDHPDDVRVLVAALAPPSLPVPYGELDRLRSEGFPGNVRSLKSVLEAAIGAQRSDAMPSPPGAGHARASVADPEPPASAEPLSFRDAKQEVVDRFEREYLVRLLDEHDGNVSQAARAAGVARSHFITLLQKHELG
jgi:DNA-binding NtrC family response regulator